MEDTNQEPDCQCEQPGFCPRYGIQMNAVSHGVCSGKGSPGAPCSPQKSELYRSKWRKIAERRSGQGLVVVVPQNPTTQSQPTKQRQERRYAKQPEASGPGTELKNLLASIGLTPQGCNCNSRVQQMNKWGIEGCRQNREAIINWLREEEKKRGWGEKLKAGVLTITTGLVASISPTDSLGSLVDLAIQRAEDRRSEQHTNDPQ